MSAAELESSKRRLRFTEDEASPIGEKVQNRGPQLDEIEAVPLATDMPQEAVKSSL